MISAIRRTPFWVQIVAGLALGIGLGLVARTYDVAWLATALETLGAVFVGLLKAAVPPLVFTAIVVSIANLRQVANAARLATQTLVWFMITSLIAVTIGIGLGLLTNPGLSADVSTDGAAYDGSTGSWLDFLTGLVPQNFLGLSAADGAVSFSVLQIVVVALAIGAAALRRGRRLSRSSGSCGPPWPSSSRCSGGSSCSHRSGRSA
jgi:Na+/H+-dicarboxylate symporter